MLLLRTCTRHSSRLLRRPYSPTSFNSASRRSFSKGRLGFLKVLPSGGKKYNERVHKIRAYGTVRG